MRDKKPSLPPPRLLPMSISALLLALACLLFTPLSAAACGGLFSADVYTEQSAERLIFAVDPGQVTLYEQIRYTGSPKEFAWVLPVPAVPHVDTAPASLFQDLDQQTAPTFSRSEAPGCNGGVGAAPPQSANSVNVYSGGTVGPYSYNVIGSSDPHALTQWLTGHHYKIPAESQTEMQPYIAAHMLFLAMRLQGTAGVQDMTPVKITYASHQPAITLPLRMATPMSNEPLQVLVWIFASGRYVPQNYQSLQLDYDQLNKTTYPDLVNQAVSKVNGHGFVTEDAQPTSNLFATTPEEAALKAHYSYLTRLYTSINPSQITLDPAFVAQSGLPNVSSEHAINNPASSQAPFCPPPLLTIGGVLLGGIVVIVLGITLVATLRKRKSRLS